MITGPVPPVQTLTVAADDGLALDALLLEPAAPLACYVFAHGAGAGMDHAFMAAFAGGLAARGVAVLRFQFPFMQAGSKRVDRPEAAHRAVRAAVAEAARRFPRLPLLAGGKSFGGRMSSQAQAEAPFEGVVGLVFVGFPLHPAGKPATERADHLDAVTLPMLFLQGTRDELAELDLVRSVCGRLGTRAVLEVVADADHAFHVRAKSGRDDEAAREAMLDATAAWLLTRALDAT